MLGERNYSPLTQHSYRDMFRLFLPFAAKRSRCSPDQLPLSRIQPKMIRAFIQYLEEVRHCGPATINQRMGALRAWANFVATNRFQEQLGAHAHSVLVQAAVPPVQLSGVQRFPFRDNCAYNESGFRCKVPARHYFLMGDNRDSSSDSRYWGFVPEQNIVGRAFLIWWNFDDLKRIGRSIN